MFLTNLKQYPNNQTYFWQSVKQATLSRYKIFNDPVHGFINVRHKIIFDLIEHPYFQRLRRIKQLGLTDYVYPGALHTRFHHAIGACHLMSKAIDTLRLKGNEITNEEEEGALIAILLHDIGHGPFSHTLESCLIKGVSHEKISKLLMAKLNEAFNGKLSLAIEIFKNKYPKRFLNQLVSSQLDVDRLDYLTRDSFFTGVSEGVVNYNRIIDMLEVHNDEVVVEAKGIHSVEKFLISRSIMYWQVYLHKTVVCAESMLVKIMERALYLANRKFDLPASAPLAYFLNNNVTKTDFNTNDKALQQFVLLDDYDIFSAIKAWQFVDDKVLAFLSKSLINRQLFKIEVFDEPVGFDLEMKKQKIAGINGFADEELAFIAYDFGMSNSLYNPKQTRIKILAKNGKTKDIAEASDQWNLEALGKPVQKYYLCYPKVK